MNIGIFEDQDVGLFSPLTLTRPVYHLRCGMSILQDKIIRHFPNAKLYLFCREYLAESVRERYPNLKVNQMPDGDCLLFNGRFLFAEMPEETHGPEMVWRNNGFVAAAKIDAKRYPDLCDEKGVMHPAVFDGLPEEEINGAFLSYPWNLIQHNADEIIHDFTFMDKGGQILGDCHPTSTLLSQENIYIGEGAQIKPGAVLDAKEGPIYLGANSIVMANASLQGPLFVGANSQIKMGATIYSETSIGEVCKMGGEVECSIVQSYSNKQHGGFLGHSYVGEWVNIGADSNTSDLKNNYANVKLQVRSEMVDSGSQFVGLFIGDHSKCAINTMFNSGTIVGVMCNIFGAGFPDKYIPSFSWGGSARIDEYDLEKALAVARLVMERRNLALTPIQEKMLRYLFADTSSERDR